MRRTTAVLSLMGGALLLSACGSSAPHATSTTTSTAVVTTTSTSQAARNLLLTPGVRRSLLVSAAAFHQLPVSDYTGLAPGTAYYAYDPVNGTHYAAAGLAASPHSLQAQIGDQDDGAYLLFTKGAGVGSWKVYNDGLGAAQDSTCPITIPATVLAAWHWKPKSCYPPQAP
jgi:hypothetical protein